MKYTLAFFIKLALTLILLWATLGVIFNVSFTDILITGLLLTVIAFAGDMWILPKIGNVAAAVSDFALAYLGIWIIGSYLFGGSVLSIDTAAFLAAFLITVCELFYHRYLRNFVFNHVDRKQDHFETNSLQTEISDEFHNKKDKK